MTRHDSRGGSGRLAVSLAERLLAASASPDLAGWSELLAENVTFRVGNRLPVMGKAKAMKEVSWLFSTITGIGKGFRFVRPATDHATVLMELEATLTGATTRVPLAMVLRPLISDGRIADLRIYLDRMPPGAAVTPRFRKSNAQ